MKLIINKILDGSDSTFNIEKLELLSIDFETSTFQINSNDIPLIIFTDTSTSFFINKLSDKLTRVNSDGIFEITEDDLVAISSGGGGVIPGLQEVVNTGNIVNDNGFTVQQDIIDYIRAVDVYPGYVNTYNYDQLGNNLGIYIQSSGVDYNEIMFFKNTLSSNSETHIKDSLITTEGIKNFELPNKPAGDYTLATIDDIPGGGSEPLVYIATLTQSSTNAPVATVIRNTLGGTVVWTRNGAGSYRATLSGAFTIGKTIGFTQWDRDDNPLIKIGLNIKFTGTANFIEIYVNDIGTGNPVDNNLDIDLKIEVYP